MSRRRVVITGIGAVTPLGHTARATFAACVAGANGVAPITRFQAGHFPTTFAAEVKDFRPDALLPNSARYKNCGLNTQFALAAAREALADADIRPESDGLNPATVGVYLGAGEGSEDFPTVISGAAMASKGDGRTVDHGQFTRAALGLLHAAREAELEMHTTAGHVAREFHLCGPNFTCLTACAASAQAIGEAAELIRYGDAEVMLAGGSHSMIHPFGVTGFNLLTALSTRRESPATASRPFDLTRDGFVLGEGAGMVVLEEYEHAKRRGATIYGELTGYGTTGDAYRMTDPHPEARSAGRCMADAIRNAGLNPEQIGYVNAHGTSTQANDETETLGIKLALGDELARRTPVSSIKSMMGHLIAAGGAVELIVSVLAMREGALPPTINLEHPDPACDLDYVPREARRTTTVRHILSNSFGFGGQNIALVASLV